MSTPFRPEINSTVSLNVSSNNASIALLSTGANLLLTNTGSALCYARLAALSGIAASTSDLPILSNSALIIQRDVISDLYLSAITESSTTTLKATSGSGN